MSALAELDTLATGLRRIGDPAFAHEIAEDASVALRKESARTISEAKSPSGEPWASRKRGGGAAYAHLSNKVTADVFGTLVRAKIEGPEAYAQYGTHKMQRRQLLPDAGGGLPDETREIIVKAAEKTIAARIAEMAR